MTAHHTALNYYFSNGTDPQGNPIPDIGGWDTSSVSNMGAMLSALPDGPFFATCTNESGTGDDRSCLDVHTKRKRTSFSHLSKVNPCQL